jgi:hypothetical protein
MGHKQSSTANWTVNDWAFGTGQNAVPLEDVVEEVSELPGKLFGAKAIENDQSMHQMQHDLLSFDEVLKKRLFFWRKKSKRQGQEYDYQDEQYYDENQQYDQSQFPIPEEDENHLEPIYANENQPATNRDANANVPWRCRYCTTENKSTDLQCRQCKQSGTVY